MIIRCISLCLALSALSYSQTVVFNDDFEIGDLSEWTQGLSVTGASITLDADLPHSGSFSVKHILSGAGTVQSLMRARFPATAIVYARMFFYPDAALDVAGDIRILQLFDGAANAGQFVALRSASGELYLKLEGQAAAGTTAISKGKWHSVELLYDASHGMAAVYLDNTATPEARASGLPLANADSIRVGTLGKGTGTLYFDDVLVSTTRAGAPESNVRVRHANTHSRSELPLRTTLWGCEPADQLTVEVDSVEQSRYAGAVTGTLVPVLDMASLPAGWHTLAVKLLDSRGAIKAQALEKIRKYVDGTPAVSIDRNNSLSLNGELIFPVTPSVLNPNEWTPYWAAGLVNKYGMFSGYSTDYNPDQYRRFIEAIGQPSIGPNGRFCNSPATFCINEDGAVAAASAYAAQLKDHPNVLAWTWIDEPDLGGTPPRVLPRTVQAVTDAVHEIDGNHPQIVNLYGYQPKLTKQKGFLYPNLVADVYSMDAYPHIYPAAGNVADWVMNIDQWQRYNFGLTPWMVYVEAGVQRCYDPPACTNAGTPYPPGSGPTPAEVRMEAWLAVIHGAKGIAWWGPETAAFTYIDEARKREMAKFVSEIEELKSIVLSGVPGRTVVDDADRPGARVDTMIREDAGNVWVFAARLSEAGEVDTITARFAVSGLVGAVPITVFGEDRTISALDGLFTDSFAPDAVHIYRVPKAAEGLRRAFPESARRRPVTEKPPGRYR